MHNKTLHVATAYTNPMRWETRKRLMHTFRQHMTASPNVSLHVGEAAYGDRAHEVTSSQRPNDLQLRTRHELWHKENLLNLVIARFPADWEYGAFVDGDFTMSRHDWALEAIHQLQRYDFVQLFSTYADLDTEHRPYRLMQGFALNHLSGSLRNMRGCPVYGSKSPGATGGGWAFRREAFNTVGGLLDTCIVGSADWHMAFGLIGKSHAGSETKSCSSAYIRSILNWQRRAGALKANIGYIQNHAIHHFHGSKVNRFYGERWRILHDNNFDPETDIHRDSAGLWQLSGNKPRLRDELRGYFHARNEDDPCLHAHEKVLV